MTYSKDVDSVEAKFSGKNSQKELSFLYSIGQDCIFEESKLLIGLLNYLYMSIYLYSIISVKAFGENSIMTNCPMNKN